MTEVTVEIDIEDAIEDAIGNIDMSDYIDIDSIRWDLEGHFVNDDDFDNLKDEVQELREEMEKLLEVINLPDEPASDYQVLLRAEHTHLRIAYQERREERYNTIRYMSKPELVAWCEENDYDVDGMTVKEIHEMIL